jgi:hypothetical protein
MELFFAIEVTQKLAVRGKASVLKPERAEGSKPRLKPILLIVDDVRRKRSKDECEILYQ